jgi:glycosyltransferase involved in cell wall biosynthesis
MVGRHAGYVSTQGLILADLLREAGYEVIAVSAILNRFLRLADIIWTIIRRRREIDLLVIQTFGGPSFVIEDVVSYLGRRFGHRIIMHLHGGAMPEFMARYPQWTRRVLSRADLLVTPSEFLARAVKPYAARIIPNVIDLSDYPYRQRQKINPRLFWMRCFHPIYNPAMAVRALSRLRSAFPLAELVLAGQDEGMEAGIRRLAQTVGLNGAVRFPGFLNRAEKAQEGDAADIFINTSHVDNMPVTIVEACAMGLPVITTDVGGIKDLLIDGETGLLVPDNDDEAMCKAITRLLNDPALAGRLSNNGRRLAERSSWQQIRPQWEQVFAEVMRGRNAAL